MNSILFYIFKVSISLDGMVHKYKKTSIKNELLFLRRHMNKCKEKPFTILPKTKKWSSYMSFENSIVEFKRVQNYNSQIFDTESTCNCSEEYVSVLAVWETEWQQTI